MADKKNVDERHVLALPPLFSSGWDASKPEVQPNGFNIIQNPDTNMESTVKRLIAHLKDEK